MIFTLLDRNYNTLDGYDTEDYLIGSYLGSIIKSLDIEVLVSSENADKWVEGNYVICSDKKGHNYWFTIYDVEDSLSSNTKSLKCYSGTIDIVGEDANPIARPSTPQPFEYYFNKIFFDTGIELGINELEGLNQSLQFDSTESSNAEMLQYVLNAFYGANAELVVELEGSIPKKIFLNVFRRLGSKEPKAILSDDSSIESMNRSGSISNLATCLNAEGVNPDDFETPLTLEGKYYEELDENGDVAYYSPVNSHRVFSVKAREKFFVSIPGKEEGEFDGYINKSYSSQATTQDSLWTESLKQLKKIDSPELSYDVKGYIDCNLGDNVQIINNEMQPPIVISARVIEYKFNDDVPSRNQFIFGDYKALESNIDEFATLMKQVKESIIFVDSMIVDYAKSSQGVEPPESGWVDTTPIVEPGEWLWSRTTTSLTNGDQTFAYSVSRVGNDGVDGVNGEDGYTPVKGVDYFDGKDGEDGYTPIKGTDYFDGKDGQDGVDGESSYLWVRYSQNSNGYPMTLDPTGALYIGTAVTQSPSAPSSYGSYKWTKVKGTDGINGEDGADGVSSYLHIKYSNDGGATFTPNNGEDVGDWIGTYVDDKAADATSVSVYTWNKVKGEPGKDGEDGYTPIKGTDYFDGIDGTNGTDGKSNYLWVRYSQNSNGNPMTTNPSNAVYIGTAVTETPTAPGSYTSYKWVKVKGSDGVNGEDGADGQSRYLHIKYSNDGGSTFTTNNGEDVGDWIGTYVDSKLSDPNTPSTYKWNKVKGEPGSDGKDGTNGTDGKDGRGISSTVIRYQASTSGTSIPTGTWVSSIPSVGPNQYLWTRTVINYTSGTPDTAYSIGKIGANGTDGSDGTNGKDGANGTDGKDGVGISSSNTRYQVSSSGTSIPTGSWLTSVPSVGQGQYLWTKTTLIFTNGGSNVSYSVGRMGVNGTNGSNGSDGKDGVDGQNAITGYLTNESIVVPANSSGTVTSYTGANGYFRVMDGNSQATSDMTFSRVSQSGCTVTVSSSGYYSVSDMTSDVGSAILQVVYKGATLQKILMVVKNKQGQPGANGSDGKDGTNGTNGTDGQDGRGISSTVIAYQASSSGTSVPTGTWLSSPPSVGQNQYLWTRTTINYTSGSPSVSYSIGKMGANGSNGSNGSDGSDGSDGVGISSSNTRYQVSSSGTSIPTGSWLSSVPSVGAGQYLWTRVILSFTNGTTNTSYSVGRMGVNGTNGKDGAPTGIVEQSSVPSSSVRYVGMLWRNTGASGYINGATYKWTGSSWQIFLLHVANLSVSTLSAISANIGEVTAGVIKGADGTEWDLDTGAFKTVGAYGTVLMGNGEIYAQTVTGDPHIRIYPYGINLDNDNASTYISLDSSGLLCNDLGEGRSVDINPYGVEFGFGGMERILRATPQGFEIFPRGATGDALNTGLELKGNVSYIDFHESPGATEDYGARIRYNASRGDAGARLDIMNPKDDIRMMTLGNLHVFKNNGSTYTSVRAKSFDPQSAYSTKTGFNMVPKEQLLEEVIQTDIVGYNYENDDSGDEYVGFVVNDNGRSPFNTSDRLVNNDGTSYNLTSAVGMSFASIKALYERIRRLEALVNG